MSDRRLELVFAAERLVPQAGGAERFALELLGRLSERHRIRALCIRTEPGAHTPRSLPDAVELDHLPAPDDRGLGYWATKRMRREAIGVALDRILAQEPADVVLTQLHAGPAAVEAARTNGAGSLLLLPSYEAFCKYAFDAGSRCLPSSGCRQCPRARRLSALEFEELRRSRATHARALRMTTGLLAPSRALADVCEGWIGRRPPVVPSTVCLPPCLPARPDGYVLFAAATWSRNKGVDLIEPIARALPERNVVVTEQGLHERDRRRLTALPNMRITRNAPAVQLLRDAALLLVPSQVAESFGRLAFEGLAAGVPVLAAARGGLTEFVPEGQLVAPADEPKAWVAAIRGLMSKGRWHSARAHGLAAAELIVTSDPVGRVERLLVSLAEMRPRARQALPDLAPARGGTRWQQ